MEAKIIKMPERKEAPGPLTIRVRWDTSSAWRVKIGGVMVALGAAIMGVRLEGPRD